MRLRVFYHNAAGFGGKFVLSLLQISIIHIKHLKVQRATTTLHSAAPNASYWPLTIGLIVRSLLPEIPGRRRNQTISPSRPNCELNEPNLSPFGRARSEESVWFGSCFLSISNRRVDPPHSAAPAALSKPRRRTPAKPCCRTFRSGIAPLPSALLPPLLLRHSGKQVFEGIIQVRAFSCPCILLSCRTG
ncbi:hypothetical protein C4D60_Mb00t00520 [Musa balbisiana]|uniref:Uncharacterized protein n=1 Tax=Musa balbisiana TaxID=52838 RepID=A0A4S8I4U1_MUSBA|nr:hypothetical protein C4D60_Mb00t00520 [Musa balbisiana]